MYAKKGSVGCLSEEEGAFEGIAHAKIREIGFCERIVHLVGRFSAGYFLNMCILYGACREGRLRAILYVKVVGCHWS